MFCPRCGKENDDKAMFCEQCGENLKENNQNVRVSNNSKVILIICGVCFIGIISVCIFMFFKDKNDFQFSNLRFKEVAGGVDVVGKVKNNSGKDCSLLDVNYEYKSGSFIEEDTFFINDIANGDTIDISERNYDLDVDEINDYIISVKNVECIVEG